MEIISYNHYWLVHIWLANYYSIVIQLQECIKAQVEDKDNALPVVYHELYNLKHLPYSMGLKQMMVEDKSAQVYAILQSMYI